jgi:hypothetical protein
MSSLRVALLVLLSLAAAISRATAKDSTSSIPGQDQCIQPRDIEAIKDGLQHVYNHEDGEHCARAPAEVTDVWPRLLACN